MGVIRVFISTQDAFPGTYRTRPVAVRGQRASPTGTTTRKSKSKIGVRPKERNNVLSYIILKPLSFSSVVFVFSPKDKRVQVFCGLNHETHLPGQLEQRPRSPVTAAEIPPRPEPSPSPTKPSRRPSPTKQLEMQDSFNPLITRGLTVPQNTPEKKSKV